MMAEIQETLETLIDGSSVETVLDQLAETCFLKADHLRTNWQDENMAKAWEKLARRIGKINATGI